MKQPVCGRSVWETFVSLGSRVTGMMLLGAAVILASVGPASGQGRLLGIDISAWQGNISTGNWATLKRPTGEQVGGVFGDGRDFVFIRSSRGGTTGYYNQSNAGNDDPPGQNTLSQRYDDPYFIQNITRATSVGMLAGPYHFGRMDIIETTLNANGIPNNGTDEANHFLQMAGPWMRPGYLLPVFDFEAGNGFRTASELAQFAIDFSDRILAVKGIRPAVYIGNNYASPMNNIALADEVVAAYPTLWNARWPNQADPNSIPIHTTDPGDYTSTVYGPWDNSPNPPDPWSFWQYCSTGQLNAYSGNLDLDVAHGGIEFVKDKLVPALWTSPAGGKWETVTNWNSGETPVAPVQGEGQVARVGTMVLPTLRAPGRPDAATGVSGADDTVILDRPNENITVTVDATTPAVNIRKLYVKEALNITGSSLTVNYVPSADSTPISAQFTAPVSLSGTGAFSVHTLQVDAGQTFTLGGGSLTIN